MKKVFSIRCKSSNKISKMIVTADDKEQALETARRFYEKKQDIIRLNAQEVDLDTCVDYVLLSKDI